MATLNDTTDARIWAEEFCRIFNDLLVWGDGPDDGRPIVNEGTMISWFANAIETGRNAGRKETCPHAPEDQSTLADDLSACGKCGEVFVEPSG